MVISNISGTLLIGYERMFQQHLDRNTGIFFHLSLFAILFTTQWVELKMKILSK